MNRRNFLENCVGTSFLAASTAVATDSGGLKSAAIVDNSSIPKENSKKPNILILMVDQQRPDSLGCYGSKIAKTPNIDAIASDGILFENCYVQNPLCCPSRYSMLTGQYPHCHGVVANWYEPRPDQKSFAEYLGRAGYQSAAIGKMHLTPWYDNFGFDGRIIAEQKSDIGRVDDYGDFLKKNGLTQKDLYPWDNEYLRQCTAVDSKAPADYHIDTFVGKSVCEYLNRIDTGVPFCCMGSFVSPHNPYDPPKPYNKMFDNVKFPPINMTAGEVDRKPREAYNYINRVISEDWGVTTDKLSNEQLHLIWSKYYSLNSFLDQWVGRIIETLKNRGLYDNTVIIYTSDHGDMLGDHGLIFKQCFYEQSVKVPLIIHCPERFKPKRVENPVELIDLFNTICDLGNTRKATDVQSKSLLGILDGQKDYSYRDAVFSENYFGKMIRMDNWKMVYYIGKDYGELYNLQKDTEEQDNLWDNSKYSDVKNKLKLRLLDWVTASQETVYLPTREKHHDISYRDYIMIDGASRESDVKPWHLNGFEDIYRKWNFTI